MKWPSLTSQYSLGKIVAWWIGVINCNGVSRVSLHLQHEHGKHSSIIKQLLSKENELIFEETPPLPEGTYYIREEGEKQNNVITLCHNRYGGFTYPTLFLENPSGVFELNHLPRRDNSAEVIKLQFKPTLEGVVEQSTMKLEPRNKKNIVGYTYDLVAEASSIPTIIMNPLQLTGSAPTLALAPGYRRIG